MNNKLRSILASVLLFTATFLVYWKTASPYLMFDDAAEFALVIRLGSIAHAPGFPAYIFSGMIWDTLFHGIITDAVLRLTLLSSFLVAAANVLLYQGFRSISRVVNNGVENWKSEAAAFFPALVFGLGNTTWNWANTIEAYAFQIFSMGLLLFGLCRYQETRKTMFSLLAAFALALGWSNHHLTMIVFTPFVPLFFLPGLFINVSTTLDKKKKGADKKDSLFVAYFSVWRMKDFLLFTGISALVTISFYGWMLWRAQNDYPFMFGKPENLDELFFHIRGGAYTKNITETKGDIIASRLPYFLQLTSRQFFLFTPLLILGIIELFRKRVVRLASVVLIYFLLLLIYQLNNNQWASTDAYLLLPFIVLCIPLVYGFDRLFSYRKLIFLIPLLSICTVVMGFDQHNRNSYPVSEDLMELLDKSAPKNSVVLLSDWTTVIQYYFYRNENNFRSDLDVLHYDFKFTHHHLLPLNNPALYQKIKPEYDQFIEAMRTEHPYQIVNTGCDLSTPELNAIFKNLVLKTEQVCKETGRTFLTDPRTHYLFSTSNFYNPARYVSGCFSSNVPTDTSFSVDFLNLNLKFLDSPLLLDDPSCLDKLVDFQAMMDQQISFYTANKNELFLQRSNATRDRIMRIQRDLKRKMSFAYKI